MQVTVTVPDELAAQPHALGVAVETYAQKILERAAAPAGRDLPEMAQRKMSEEEVVAWLDELAQFSDKIPPMPGETFSREMIYQDHD